MSSESLAAFRKSDGDDLAKLAEEHIKHDLQEPDREALKSAARKVYTHATIGSALGLGLGLFLAYRLRTNRTKIFEAFKAVEKPTHVQFANGRTEPIPDITPLLKPTPLGDIAAYFFFGGGGLFFGGELGLLSGSTFAARTISSDSERRARIEAAFRKFKADALRRQADLLDGGKGTLTNLLGN